MNFVAQQIIERERGDGKFIALMGYAHADTMEGVPGMSQILGCPNVLIRDSKENRTKISKDTMHFDGVLELPTGKIYKEMIIQGETIGVWRKVT